MVLHCGSSTDRFESAKTLLNHGFANYALVDTEPPETLLPLRVSLGETDLVTPVLQETAPILMEKSEISRITKTVDLPQTCEAPITKGQQLGTMTICAGERMIAQIPIEAGASVDRLTLWQMTVKLLRGLCMAGERN